jgi:hypothetical protein
MLEGEILIREGNLEVGIAELRSVVKNEDALRYDEPPGCLIPVRHSLGASLMQASCFAEAEQVYREDLERPPQNGCRSSVWRRASSGRAKRKKPSASRSCTERSCLRLMSRLRARAYAKQGYSRCQGKRYLAISVFATLLCRLNRHDVDESELKRAAFLGVVAR